MKNGQKTDISLFAWSPLISFKKLEQIPYFKFNKPDRFYKVKLFMTFDTEQFWRSISNNVLIFTKEV